MAYRTDEAMALKKTSMASHEVAMNSKIPEIHHTQQFLSGISLEKSSASHRTFPCNSYNNNQS